MPIFIKICIEHFPKVNKSSTLCKYLKPCISETTSFYEKYQFLPLESTVPNLGKCNNLIIPKYVPFDVLAKRFRYAFTC